MNFAKNTVCLQCDAKRPKRQLLPGEWECPECNFLNYRRTMACFHCDYKRPPDDVMENKMEERRQGLNMRMEKIAKRPEVSNAWNFDFDDDELDGADVAAFEYADSSLRDEDSPLDSQVHAESFRGYEDDFNKSNRVRGAREREHSDAVNSRPGIGFDDFDDEDDVDSYEIDTLNNYSMRKASSNNLSEGFSGTEDIEGSDNNFHGGRRAPPQSNNKPSKLMHQKAAFSGSEDDELDFDTDEELSVHPNWKSSHFADFIHRSRGRGPTDSSRRLSFGSDEEFGPPSDLDDDIAEDFKTRPAKGNKAISDRNYRRRVGSDMEDADFSDLESDIDGLDTRKNKFGRNKIENVKRGNNFKDCDNYSFVNDGRFRSNDKMDNRRNSMNDFVRSSRQSRGDQRGSKWNDYGGRRINNRKDDSRNFNRPKREGFGSSKREMSHKYDGDANGDPSEFKNSRRVIER